MASVDLLGKRAILGMKSQRSILRSTAVRLHHIHYLLAKLQIFIENELLFSIFLSQNIEIILLMGQNRAKKLKSGGNISMKPDADIVMRKLAQNPSFCGLQKLNTLNLYSFCPSQNPRRHFSTV